MLIGTVVCMVAMLLLGFTRPVASIFTSWHTSAVRFPSDVGVFFLSLKVHQNDVLTISLAVLSIYLIDFAINAGEVRCFTLR